MGATMAGVLLAEFVGYGSAPHALGALTAGSALVYGQLASARRRTAAQLPDFEVLRTEDSSLSSEHRACSLRESLYRLIEHIPHAGC